MMLQVAIFGSGRVAKVRLREVDAHSGWRPAAILGSSPERIANLASGLPTFTKIADLLESVPVDAVMICGANQDHFSQAMAALEAGKHVSIDYPMALTLAEGEQLAKTAASRGLVLHVEHIDLLSPWYVAMRRALPRLGRINTISWTDLSNRQRKDNRDWVFDRRSGFSLVMHAAIFSRMLGLANSEVAYLQCHEELANMPDIQSEHSFSSRVTRAQGVLANGIVLQILDGIGQQVAGPSSNLIVYGELGILSAHAKESPLLQLADGDSILEIEEGPGLFQQDVDCFYQKITAPSANHYVDLDHSLRVLRAGELARLSAESRDRL